jgi:hypothetical protein
MTNADISDLHGVYATPLRWNAETGVLGYGAYNETTGERKIIEINLDSPRAKFVMDLATRERGYGLIRSGLYDMRLSPVGAPPPEWPGDDDFRPAVACWLWNPPLGELRLESNQATLLRSFSELWDRARTFKEAAEGLQPVVHFSGRRERFYRQIGKAFIAPVIDIIGWVPRDKVPPFAMRAPTVKAPAALDTQVRFALLGAPKQTPGKSSEPANPGSLDDILEDEIPENH